MIQVFTTEDRDKLLQKGLLLLGEQQIGDKTAYIFDNNKMNFDLSDVISAVLPSIPSIAISWVNLGAMFERTEITPFAPKAVKAVI